MTDYYLPLILYNWYFSSQVIWNLNFITVFLSLGNWNIFHSFERIDNVEWEGWKQRGGEAFFCHVLHNVAHNIPSGVFCSDLWPAYRGNLSETKCKTRTYGNKYLTPRSRVLEKVEGKITVSYSTISQFVMRRESSLPVSQQPYTT